MPPYSLRSLRLELVFPGSAVGFGHGLAWMGPVGSVLLADALLAQPPPPHFLPRASGCTSKILL